jgi:hypothetical protein
MSLKRLDWFAAQPLLRSTCCRIPTPIACGNLAYRTKNVVESQRLVPFENLLAGISFG